jgi:hypothetical protein
MNFSVFLIFAQYFLQKDLRMFIALNISLRVILGMKLLENLVLRLIFLFLVELTVAVRLIQVLIPLLLINKLIFIFLDL